MSRNTTDILSLITTLQISSVLSHNTTDILSLIT